MLRLFCHKLLLSRSRDLPLTSHGKFFTTSSHNPIPELKNTTYPQSLTVSYLQNSCGLSLKSAISVSEKLHIDTTHKPDSVLNLLKAHGLTQTHIENLITKRPFLLLADLEKTLKPNLELLESLGFTSTSLARMLDKDPKVLETDTNTTVEFFRANGFSEKQIATFIMKRPTLCVYNAEKTFKPKMEFFSSLGFSQLEIAKILSFEPYILERSLENQIIPCVQFLKRVLVTDENVLKAVKACSRILEFSIEKVLEPNISILLNHGVPKSLILKLILIQPKSLLLRTYRLNEIVGEVKKLGFDPTSLLFVLAIRSMAVMGTAVWEKKLKAYMSFGLTKEDIYSAFKRQPMCMLVSEEKIKKLMGFYVKKLSMEPLIISKNPNILLLSMEKRILPRCAILQLLMSKGLIMGDLKPASLVYVFKMTESQFVKKFLEKYQHNVPEIIMAHQGKIKFEGFPSDLKM